MRCYNSYQGSYPYTSYPCICPQVKRQGQNSSYQLAASLYGNQHSYSFPSYITREATSVKTKDYGPHPFVKDIEKITEENNTYRTAIWTGKNLQVTVMSIGVGDDIGLEVHPSTDQFIRIEQGQALVQMGNSKGFLDFNEEAREGYAIIIPAGKWHNVVNTGNKPLKVYVIYAPPEHPHGTVHMIKPDDVS